MIPRDFFACHGRAGSREAARRGRGDQAGQALPPGTRTQDVGSCLEKYHFSSFPDFVMQWQQKGPHNDSRPESPEGQASISDYGDMRKLKDKRFCAIIFALGSLIWTFNRGGLISPWLGVQISPSPLETRRNDARASRLPLKWGPVLHIENEPTHRT
jgi:hypothetical protein